MTQPDIYTVEARRRLAAAYVSTQPWVGKDIVDGISHTVAASALAATLRELNWQPPVDPDLVEARKIAADFFRNDNAFALADYLERGEGDANFYVRAALAAIKCGRELAARGGA